ncbi:hypothetical protein ACFFSY_18615 [Paenibacillus aurantiacus]|uniref:Uncharacterized protein n=1 Tax=Paenibacillus aurantiacus TaxID=1936118 RepID=A0ABV5KU64_9BACL
MRKMLEIGEDATLFNDQMPKKEPHSTFHHELANSSKISNTSFVSNKHATNFLPNTLQSLQPVIGNQAILQMVKKKRDINNNLETDNSDVKQIGSQGKQEVEENEAMEKQEEVDPEIEKFNTIMLPILNDIPFNWEAKRGRTNRSLSLKGKENQEQSQGKYSGASILNTKPEKIDNNTSVGEEMKKFFFDENYPADKKTLLKNFIDDALENAFQKDEKDLSTEEKRYKDPDIMMALRWVRDLFVYRGSNKSGKSTGSGTLDVEVTDESISITGRPAFEKDVSISGMRDGLHRRHIIAWHTIKGAVQNVANHILSQGGTVEVLYKHFHQLYIEMGIEKELQDKKTQLVEQLKIKDNAKLQNQLKNIPEIPSSKITKDLEFVLKKVLSKLNSNVKNLWPGDGYENSLINSYQESLRGWSNVIKEKIEGKPSPEQKEQLVKEVKSFLNKKLDELKTRISTKDENKAAYSDILSAIPEILIPMLQPEDIDVDEIQQLLLDMADNYEVDWPHVNMKKKEKNKDEDEDEDEYEDMGDHKYLQKHGIQLPNHMLKIGGKFLNWSEEKGDIFNSNNNADQALTELIQLINEFWKADKQNGNENFPKKAEKKDENKN